MAGVMEAAVDRAATKPKTNIDRWRGEVKIFLQFSLRWLVGLCIQSATQNASIAITRNWSNEALLKMKTW